MDSLRGALRLVVAATRNFHRDRCFDRSAVISYFSLLSFLPLAVVLVAVSARVLGSLDAAERGTELLLSNVVHRLPPGIMTEVRALQQNVWSGLSSLLFAIWSASRVFAKIETGLDSVFRVERRRPWALRKFLSFAFVGFLSLLLVTAVLFGGLLNAFERFIDSTSLTPLLDLPLYHLVNGVWSRYVLPWGLAVLSFVLVYRIVPARTVPWRAAVVGGGVSGTLWELLKVAFTDYVSDVGSYSRTYGALATVVVFLLWMNLSSALLLWGAELSAVSGGIRSGPEPP
jgi:membrane protein